MSVFNCNITYRKVEGNSELSTKNKLMSQGFIDKYYNIKDVAKFRVANSELSAMASGKLRREVRLFSEKRLLNGIRAVPDMKLFGMIDQLNKSPLKQPEIVLNEIGIDEFGDSITDNLAPLDSKSISQQIYEKVNQPMDSFIKQSDLNIVQPLIDRYNELNTGKVLSLVETNILGKYLISTEYKSNYLYTPTPVSLTIEESFEPTDSNNNFNLPCI